MWANETIVLPDGPKDAKLVIVGEAPGEEEVRLGKGFVGQSGAFLWKELGTLGIRREHCWVTNVVKRRPYKNKIEGIPAEELAEWTERLFEELAQLTEARLVLLVGGTALKAVTGLGKIMKYRGSVLWCERLGKKVMAVQHPASILRVTNTVDQYPFRLDVRRAKEEMAFPELRRVERTLTTHPNFEEVERYLEECLELPRVGFDIETTTVKKRAKRFAQDLFCFSVAKSGTDSMCVSFVESNGEPRFSVAEVSRIMDGVAKLLEAPQVLKVGQNIMFDTTFMLHFWGMQTWPIADTMVAHKILYPDFKADLGFLVSTMTREPYYKDSGGKFFKANSKGGWSTEVEQLWEDFLVYSALDSALVMDIMPYLEGVLKQRGLREVYDRHIAIHEPLWAMQEHGYLVDVAGLAHQKVKVSGEIKEMEALLEEQTGVKGLNVKSGEQVKAYLAGQGVKVPTRRGKETLDKKAKAQLAAKGVAGLSTMMALGKLRDDLSKYWTAPVSDDGRFRAGYKPVGTDQGRLSSTATLWGDGSNLQNQPPAMRKYFRVDPGWIGFKADLGQAENRIVALLAGEERMLRAFVEGDVHALTGALISGLTVEQVIADQDTPGTCPLAGGLYTWRYFGKRCNHGLNYDMGPLVLSENLEIPVSDAKYLHAAYHRAYPKVKAMFHARIQAELRATHTLKNLMGRTRKFYASLADKGTLNVAYSFKPQSTVADIINEWALLPLWRKWVGRTVWLLNQVHDSVELEVRKELGPEGAAEVLLDLVRSTERPLEYEGRTMVIPFDVKACLKSWGEKGVTLRTHGTEGELVSQLEEIWDG